MTDVNALLAEALAQYGVEISVSVLAMLLGLALWARRLSKVGSKTAGVASQGVRDVQLAAGLLLVLVLLGWVSIQPSQIQASLTLAWEQGGRLAGELMQRGVLP
ncbi:hypothetical protein [Halobaculum marinum]|uniref:Uncharacterized protein n=1 Tax=Halobaculum marinum TaxID=3031996 RepID=A0ABD5WR96_9EURY|nr:hypothetical protein [Halobaculum sp. DT55]